MQLADRLGRRIKLRDLNVLLAVVEAGSMSRAAERLAVSQPVVSKTVAGLELAFGVPLLDRTRHGVEPTAFGRALVVRGAAVFDDLRQAVRDIEHLADPSGGEVRLSASEALVAGFLPHAIEQVRRPHPRLRFHVRSEITGHWLYDDLRRREVDFAVGRMALRPGDADLAAEMLFHEELVVVTGRDTPLPQNVPLRLDHIRDASWILPRPDSEVGLLVRQGFDALGVELPRSVVDVNSTIMICALLASGGHFGILPSSLLRFSELRHLVQVVLPLSQLPPGPVAIVTLPGRTLTPAAELFIRHLKLLAADVDGSRRA